MKDERAKYVSIGCGNCIECRKQKAREWQVRLAEEIRTDNTGKFVTLTFSQEELKKIIKEQEKDECNGIAKLAVRRFLERWRKTEKISPKHWLVTELGHEGTERIHLHGIIWTEDKEKIEKYWKYGYVYVGEYVNEKTINYIIKYVSKIDESHKQFKPITLTSKGIGSGYIERIDARVNKYTAKKTNELYRLKNGQKTALPMYYRNKIYTEEEKEALWMEKLDKEERYVCGEKVSVKKDEKDYDNLVEYHRNRNRILGYGDKSKEWRKKDYNAKLMIIKELTKKSKKT